jgi:hypothetical protein
MPSSTAESLSYAPSLVDGYRLGQAKQRLSALPNVTFAQEDGQFLSFAVGSFDALICRIMHERL